MAILRFFDALRLAKATAFAALMMAFALVPMIVTETSANEVIEVKVDHAKVMRVSRPASTIIIGNPGIADAAVQDETTLIITGKSFGVTNMIILDEEGEPIADALLAVKGERVNAVTVYRRTGRVTYSCSPNCERSLALGDNVTAFSSVRSQIEERNSFATGSAAAQPTNAP